MTQSSDPILAPIGSRVEGLMLVHQVERRAWGEGREGIILVLGTQAGRIGTAPLWGERQAWAAASSAVPSCTPRAGSERSAVSVSSSCPPCTSLRPTRRRSGRCAGHHHHGCRLDPAR